MDFTIFPHNPRLLRIDQSNTFVLQAVIYG